MIKTYPAQGVPEENVLSANTTLEKEVLAHVIANKIIPAELTRDSFQINDHKKIFDSIDSLLAKGESVDWFTIHAAMGSPAALGDNEGFAYLVGLGEIGIPGLNIDAHVRLLNDLALKVRVVAVADFIDKGIRLGIRPTVEIITDAATKFRELADNVTPTREVAPTIAQWPSPIGDTALIGIAGDVVRLVEPCSEADPAALLLQFLVGFGNLIGRYAHYRVESDDHHTAEYVVIVGESSKARKGTSWGRIQYVLSLADKEWVANCLVSGVGSGEALIDEVAAQDHGRRRLIIEGEFARVLNVLQRDGSTMSPILRATWDSGAAAIHTRTQKHVKVTDGHLSLIAHITIDEIRKKLADVELSNGLVNRALFVLAKRSKELPFGAELPDCSSLQRRLVDAVRFGSQARRFNFDADASELWRERYSALSRAQPGLLGSICGRAEAHTIRIAIIFAVLDCSPIIQRRHLLAALEVWRYAQESAAFIWGDSLGDPVADGILAALRAEPDGLSRLDLMNLFHRHKNAKELDRAIATLMGRSLIRSESSETNGRPVTRFWAV